MSKKFVFAVETPQSTGPTVNFDEMNAYVVKTVDASEKQESMIGIVSGVIDLGLQRQEDAKMEWKGTAEEKAVIDAKIEAGETQEYFETLPHDKTKVPTLYKRWPVKPQRCVALTVDFTDVLLNRGQFFDAEGGGEELPLRGLLNNEFYMKGIGKVVGKPFSLKEQKNDDGTWGMKNNTILWKLAQATNQLDAQGNFKPAYLGNLIGEAAMFGVQVSLNEHNGKNYLNEKFSFNGSVPKNMIKAITPLEDRHMYMINFKGEQDMNAIKNLRQSIINTMMQAEDFEGSDVQKALIAAGKVKEGEGHQSHQKEDESGPKQKTPEKEEPALDFDSFDDDIPFAPIGLQEGRLFLHMI